MLDTAPTSSHIYRSYATTRRPGLRRVIFQEECRQTRRGDKWWHVGWFCVESPAVHKFGIMACTFGSGRKQFATWHNSYDGRGTLLVRFQECLGTTHQCASKSELLNVSATSPRHLTLGRITLLRKNTNSQHPKTKGHMKSMGRNIIKIQAKSSLRNHGEGLAMSLPQWWHHLPRHVQHPYTVAICRALFF